MGSGEANDGANVGGGEGVFRDKIGSTLNFKSITGSNGVVVSSTADTVDIAGPPTGLGDVVGGLVPVGVPGENRWRDTGVSGYKRSYRY